MDRDGKGPRRDSRYRPALDSLEGRQLLSTAAQDVLTFHNDNQRTGQDLNETILTPSNVNSSSFGKVGFLATDGQVDAEPLYVANLPIPGQGVHNVTFIATENDSIYAYDADDGQLLWHDGPSGTPNSILPAGQGPLLNSTSPNASYTGELGILDTPVIDPTTNTLYAVATSQGPVDGKMQVFDEIVAVDIATGAIKARTDIGPEIGYPGTNTTGSGEELNFEPMYQKEREALTLSNGIVYTAWTALEFAPPYTGWLIGFKASDLSLASVLNINPDGNPVSNSPDGTSGSDFWNSGDGFAVDAEGNLYDSTSNGPFNAADGDWGDSILKIYTGNGGTTVSDYYTPSDQQFLADHDIDVGSSGIMVLPTQTTASGQAENLVISGGKNGDIYLVNQDDLGGYNANSDDNYQTLTNALGAAEADSPAYFNGSVYFGANGMTLTQWAFNSDAQLPATPTSQSAVTFSYPGTSPSISADGNQDGIVWALNNNDGNNSAILYAYDAGNLGNMLYNSAQAPNDRDGFGPDTKFITPMIANGKVYVGTDDGVAVFGLFSGDSGGASPQAPTVQSAAYEATAPAVNGLNLLAALGSDPAYGESTLTYNWSVVSSPLGVAVPTFTQNGTNASKLVGVNYQAPGAYTFQVAIANQYGQVATSDINVTVPVPAVGVATPALAATAPALGGLNLLDVVGSDADAAGESDLTYTWSVVSSPAGAAAPTFTANGTNASKLVGVNYSAPGAYTLQATIANPFGQSTTSNVTVNVAPPTLTLSESATPSQPQVEGKADYLSAAAVDSFFAPSALTYTWSAIHTPSGAKPPTFSSNGTAASSQVKVTYQKPGSYEFRVTIADPDGETASSLLGLQVKKK